MRAHLFMTKEGLETPSIYRLALSPKGMTSTLAACMRTGIVFKKFMTNLFSVSKSEELKLPEVSSRNRMSLILLAIVNSSRSLVNSCFARSRSLCANPHGEIARRRTAVEIATFIFQRLVVAHSWTYAS